MGACRWPGHLGGHLVSSCLGMVEAPGKHKSVIWGGKCSCLQTKRLWVNCGVLTGSVESQASGPSSPGPWPGYSSLAISWCETGHRNGEGSRTAPPLLKTSFLLLPGSFPLPAPGLVWASWGVDQSPLGVGERCSFSPSLPLKFLLLSKG